MLFLSNKTDARMFQVVKLAHEQAAQAASSWINLIDAARAGSQSKTMCKTSPVQYTSKRNTTRSTPLLSSTSFAPHIHKKLTMDLAYVHSDQFHATHPSISIEE